MLAKIRLKTYQLHTNKSFIIAGFSLLLQKKD